MDACALECKPTCWPAHMWACFGCVFDLAMLFVHHQETYPLPRLDQGDDSKAFPGLGSRRRSPASGGRWLPGRAALCPPNARADRIRAQTLASAQFPMKAEPADPMSSPSAKSGQIRPTRPACSSGPSGSIKARMPTGRHAGRALTPSCLQAAMPSSCHAFTQAGPHVGKPLCRQALTRVPADAPPCGHERQ